ncbi:LysM peptidoglycan-binding domain-containing protein [Myxococcota bacterium]|jgi:hypothetical protein|nr:LysM peptidoglycan-binding domain-containing protein [Myxococcota bacterium]
MPSKQIGDSGVTVSYGGGLPGGNFAKAYLHVVDTGANFVFHFNPETISVEKTTVFQEHPTQGADSGEKEWTHGTSRSLQISELYFDTYESKENVRTAYIDALEALAHFDPDLHRPPRLLFMWGSFMAENDDYNSCQWYLQKVKVSYVMFLSDGTPVRAKVSIDLVEATTIDRQMQKDPQSPDHAKVHLVRRGDTLQSIAWREYDDPSEWKRIAEANGIDDPMNLEPGTRLLVPPILK